MKGFVYFSITKKMFDIRQTTYLTSLLKLNDVVGNVVARYFDPRMKLVHPLSCFNGAKLGSFECRDLTHKKGAH